MTEMIEAIKDDVRHDEGCATERTAVEVLNCVKAWPRECNCSRRKKIAFLESREYAAAVLYQCVGVLADNHPQRELLLDTLAWLRGTRDERPDFEALLPFFEETDDEVALS